LVALCALLAGAFALGGCGEKVSWKQKLTVTVETPEGIKTGQAVQRVRSTYTGPSTIGGNEVQYSMTGEAVVVSLAEGRYLFGLLSGPELARGAFGDRLPAGRLEYLQSMRTLKGAIATLLRDDYPLLVTFADIADPASVQRVDPDDLAASFGPGYRLQSITLEITDEPVTEGPVEAALAWSGEIPDDFWRNNLTSDQRTLLSSVNWIKD
jgi:hypothetical protein